MYAIQIKFLGPTNTKGARIKAFCAAGSVIHDFEYGDDCQYRIAALKLIDKLGWNFHIVGSGQVKSGDWVFCLVGLEGFMKVLKFKFKDSVYGRVCFKQGSQLYCLQPGLNGRMQLLDCTKDGEPVGIVEGDYSLSGLPFEGLWGRKEVEAEDWKVFLARF